MRFEPTAVDGAFVIHLDPFEDDRGLYARLFCAETFVERGLVPPTEQTNLLVNRQAGTLRGLHYQEAPHEEAKLVRCVRGGIFDVAVDMRPESSTHLAHTGIELTADNRLALYVPPRCAHGLLSLTDGSEVIYQVSAGYHPECERGVRFDDPKIGIRWPHEAVVISSKDRAWPLL